jgi:microtubule-associated protein-like 1/2
MQIATARFMFNDKNVVTVGGTDATLILWDIIDD